MICVCVCVCVCVQSVLCVHVIAYMYVCACGGRMLILMTVCRSIRAHHVHFNCYMYVRTYVCAQVCVACDDVMCDTCRCDDVMCDMCSM